MKILNCFGIIVLLLCSATIIGCDDDKGVAPPPPPPQLNLRIFSTPALPDNDVYDVFVDSKDRTWFCTASGLGVRDAGGQWEYFNQAEGLPHPMCRKIVEFNDKLWVVTWGGGIGVYNDTTWTVIGEDQGLLSNKVYDIEIDNYDPSLWFGTIDGVIQYEDNSTIPIGNRWTNHTNKVLNEEVGSIEVVESTPRGAEVWLGSKFDWISLWRPVSHQVIHLTEETSGIPGAGINDITYSPLDDVYWIAFASDGVAAVDVEASTWTQYTTEDGLPSMIANTVAVDQDGVVWVGTQRGVAEWTGERFIGYTQGSGLPDERVRSIYVDGQNRKWLSFVEGGAARILR